jgi:hypothetical protein
MHIKADLLNDVGDVGPSEGEILKSTGEAPVGGGSLTEASSLESFSMQSLENDDGPNPSWQTHAEAW